MDFCEPRESPVLQVENGSRRKNAAHRNERMPLWLILNEIWKSKMEILVKFCDWMYNCCVQAGQHETLEKGCH